MLKGVNKQVVEVVEETHTLQHLQDKLLDFLKTEKKEKKKN